MRALLRMLGRDEDDAPIGSLLMVELVALQDVDRVAHIRGQWARYAR